MKNKISKLLILFLLLLSTHNASARPMVADVNPRRIDIDQNFKGMDLLVYGARNDAGNIVVVVRGPKEKLMLRKKDKVFGVWTNVKNIELDDSYSYYAVAAMKPLDSVQNDNLLDQLEVGEDNIKFPSDELMRESKKTKLKNYVIQLMQEKNLYSKQNYAVRFWGETLFRTFINFPKNISSGIYNIDIYLFNDGALKGYQTMPIYVDKVGFEAFINGMAQNRPLAYGFISVFLALTIGFTVGSLFSRR